MCGISSLWPVTHYKDIPLCPCSLIKLVLSLPVCSCMLSNLVFLIDCMNLFCAHSTVLSNENSDCFCWDGFLMPKDKKTENCRLHGSINLWKIVCIDYWIKCPCCKLLQVVLLLVTPLHHHHLNFNRTLCLSLFLETNPAQPSYIISHYKVCLNVHTCFIQESISQRM